MSRAAKRLMGTRPTEIQGPMERGSDRRYYRLIFLGGTSLIACVYGTERPENASFSAAVRLLQDLGLTVPRIHEHDETDRWTLQEDLGDLCLQDLVRREGFSPSVKDIYLQVLREVATLHRDGKRACEASGFQPQPAFTDSLYRWETEYFCQNLGKLYLAEEWPWERLEAEFARIRSRLLDLPLCLLHRDLQSQNILVVSGRGALIDVQGMRMGPAFYDVASLLEDPYVALQPSIREELLAGYLASGTPQGDVLSYRMASCQRLMQALGAYAFLGLRKGKREYMQHIIPGLRALRNAADEAGLGTLEQVSRHALTRLEMV